MEKLNRKKFLFAGVSLATLGTFFGWKKSPEPSRSITFLTKEGKLVELDADKLPIKKKIATQSDLLNWIKK